MAFIITCGSSFNVSEANFNARWFRSIAFMTRSLSFLSAGEAFSMMHPQFVRSGGASWVFSPVLKSLYSLSIEDRFVMSLSTVGGDGLVWGIK